MDAPSRGRAAAEAQLMLAEAKLACLASIDPLLILSIREPCFASVVGHTLQNKIDAAAHGTKKLDTEHLVNLNIPIPPLSLQVAWADKARAVTSIQTQQATASTQAEATFNALLAQVFSAA